MKESKTSVMIVVCFMYYVVFTYVYFTVKAAICTTGSNLISSSYLVLKSGGYEVIRAHFVLSSYCFFFLMRLRLR